MGVESIRAPEILFQPSMVGCVDAGVMETIDLVLKQFSADDQLLLAKNIFLTGGSSNFKGTNASNTNELFGFLLRFNLFSNIFFFVFLSAGLKERLTRELTAIRPFESIFRIVQSPNTRTDAWHGARKFANSPKFRSSVTTRAEYMEYGCEYFKEHYAGNLYFPTPSPVVVGEPAQTQPDDNITATTNDDNNEVKVEETQPTETYE